MAVRYYGVNVGSKGSRENVSEAGSITSRTVELAVTYDDTGMSRVEALMAIEAIKDYITQDTWPPA